MGTEQKQANEKHLHVVTDNVTYIKLRDLVADHPTPTQAAVIRYLIWKEHADRGMGGLAKPVQEVSDDDINS